MISIPTPAFSAIPADASLRVSSRLCNRSKSGRTSSIWAVLSCMAAFLLFAIPGLAQQSLLTRHVREVVLNDQAQPLGRLPGTQVMRLDIVLPLSDQTGLDSFLKKLYDPTSPSYRHFLTVAEFTARFGPSQVDYDAAVAFAKANGLTVVGGTRDGMDVQVEGPVSAVETAFRINLRTYQHPTENRTFYAPDREPTVDLPFRLWHISGLDNYSISHTMLESKSDHAQAHGISPEAVVSHATTGSGPSASFLGSDMRAAYYGGTTLTGAGQNLGLLEYLGTDLTDLTTYFTNVGQTNNVPVTLLSTDGTSTSCVYASGCDDTEQTLDMTQAIGMAPGLSSLVMYIGSTDTVILSTMTAPPSPIPLPTTIGCSWGWTPADPSTLDPYFERMAAQGQSFFAASGDYSTWSLPSPYTAAWPADDANVVSVGGTDLITASAGGSWSSETAWVGSGGGISPNGIAIPAWQQFPGVINSSNRGSTALRNGPDVSANANWSFYTCADQTTCLANEYGGTSFAAPMWAGYIALVNQQLAANGQPTIGFLNPTIYAQNVTSAYDTDFHDITSGVSGSYSAVTGYDLVTGWGSPNGQNLISALVGPPVSGFTLSALPSSLSISTGGTATATITVNDLAGFAGSVNLSLSGLPGGVTALFSPNPAAGFSVMTLTASSTAATGIFNTILTGTSGTLIETTALVLTVATPVQITPPPPTNFGPVNVGTTSQTIPLFFTFDTAETLGGIAVLTQGAANLDFADAGSDTCKANTAYSAGQTCTVNVNFTPRFDGTRYGAAVLRSNGGSVIGTGYIQGTGTGEGPLANFLPGTQSTVVLNTSNGNAPFAVAVDGNGSVYVADSDNGVVWKETPTASGYSQQGPIGSGLQAPFGLAVDGAGNVYIVDAHENVVYKETPSGSSYSQTTICSGLKFADGVAVDGSGNVYISDSYHYRVLKETLTPTGYTQSILPTRGTDQPSGVAVDGNGNVYVADTYNGRVLEETLSAGTFTQSTVVSGLGQPQGIAVDGSGNVYIADSQDDQVLKETPSVNGYVQSIVASPSPSGVETFYGIGVLQPYGVAVDGSGNVYIADTGNDRVLKENFAVPPSLTFTSISDGTTSTGSPQTVTVENVGSAALSFPIPSSGNNPNITADFTLNSSGAMACPMVSDSSSEPGTLAAGASCQLLINFAPPTLGTYTGSLVLTDNNQNASAPGYASQSIALSGTQVSPTFTISSSLSSGAMSQGTSVTSTITVTPESGFIVNASLAASGLPSGLTASFSPNPTTGTSVLTLTASSSATPGNALITITGTAGTQTASTMIGMYVSYVPPSFSLSASSAPITVAQGSSNTSTITVVDQAGFTGSVSLAAYGLPNGVTASFSPNPTSGSSVLTLTASSSATPVSYYAIPIWGTSGTLTASTSVVLAITPPPPGFAPSSESFGSVNIGTASPVQTLTYTFGSAVTLGSAAVLTQGATGLDFADAGSDTCTANTAYSAGQTCTVNVTFTPKFAGTRYGAVVLNDTNGNVLATAYLQGSGVGPQINFLPNAESVVANSSGGLLAPYALAVDGSGNIYIADNAANMVFKETLSAGTYTESALPTSSLNQPSGVAVDGSGNVYISDTNNNRVLKETPFAGGYLESEVANSTNNGITYPNGVAVDSNGSVYFFSSSTLYIETLSVGGYMQGTVPYSGVSWTGDFAVDGNGNVYIVDFGNGQVIKETLTASGYVQSTVPTSGLNQPQGIAVDGMGNIYVANFGGGPVFKETLTAGSYVQSTISTSQLNEPLAVAVDQLGNVYIADAGTHEVLKEDFADPPSLAFASTVVGSTSTDSPKAVMVENVGNAALNFSGVSYPSSFPESSQKTTDCTATSALSSNQTCTLTIDFSPLTVGNLNGSLVLTDNALNVTSATQNISLTGTGQAPLSFTLADSPSTLTVVQGKSGTSTVTINDLNGFTGKVTLAASGLPSGVTAKFGTNPTTGSSVLTLTASSSAAVGSATITIKGTSGSLTASTTLVLTVPAPSFTLSDSPGSLTVIQGKSGTSTVTVNDVNGFTGKVTLAASGLPSGVTTAFATNPTTGSSVLTLTASSSAATGTATVTIKGTSGSLTASTTIALAISCTPTTIVPYISLNGGSTWTKESSATVSSKSTDVDLGPQPISGGSWSWTGPDNYKSTSRQIDKIPLTVGTDSYVATYTNTKGCKSTEIFTITVK